MLYSNSSRIFKQDIDHTENVLELEIKVFCLK